MRAIYSSISVLERSYCQFNYQHYELLASRYEPLLRNKNSTDKVEVACAWFGPACNSVNQEGKAQTTHTLQLNVTTVFSEYHIRRTVSKTVFLGFF